jgi:hypothetical protein
MTKAAELAKMGEVLTNSQIGGRRNIAYNGAMQISQRNTNQPNRGNNDTGYYTVDRFHMAFAGSTAGRLTMSQESITDLSGFSKAIKLACTTADTSIAADEVALLEQRFEGQDLQQLKKGTSDAEKVTVSFYVKGNAAATYTVELEDNDNSRFASQEFSVTTSWTKVTKTFVADTTGTLNSDNGLSLSLKFWFHGGSTYTGGTHTSNTWHTTTNARLSDNQTSFFDSTDRTFFITGLQLEVGSQATPFEHRSFGEELVLCQRYCIDLNPASGGQSTAPYLMQGSVYSSTLVIAYVSLPHEMRVAPTLILTGDAGNFSVVEVSTTRACTGVGINGMTNSGGGINWTCGGGGLTGGNAALVFVETNLRCIMDSEL